MKLTTYSMSKDLHNSSDRKVWEQHMLRAYSVYKQYLVEQKEMEMQDYNAQSISDTLKGLKNLTSVKMSLARCLDVTHLMSTHKAKVFDPTLHSPWGDDARTRPLGVAQLESILLGVVHHDLEIEELHCGYVHWQFFKQSDEHFDKYKLAIRLLKRLNLHISNRAPLNNPEEDIDKSPSPQSLIECARFLAGGRLRDFITAAPHLMELAIDFEYQNSVSSSQFGDIVGNFTWPALRCVHFSHITVNEAEVIDFFARHATTLKEVSLAFLRLDSGDWTSVFRRMAKILQLEKTALSGHFSEGIRRWEFDVYTGPGFRFKYVPDVVTMRHWTWSEWRAEWASGNEDDKLSDLERLVKLQEEVLGFNDSI